MQQELLLVMEGEWQRFICIPHLTILTYHFLHLLQNDSLYLSMRKIIGKVRRNKLTINFIPFLSIRRNYNRNCKNALN